MSLNESPNFEQSALRLPTLSMTPSADKLREALGLASNNVQNIIELPWKSTNSPVNYMIKVSCQANPQEPAWILHVGGEGDDAIVWNYNTADCQMIHGLITAEVDRAAYAVAGSAQPMPAPVASSLLRNPQLSPPQFIEQTAQPTVSAAVQNQQSGYDWGAAQTASQQGQDWNWSSPTAAANANWSTSSHSPLNSFPEPIVPINDPQAFSQSWGAPSPAISAPDSGLQRSTKPPGSITPEIKPPENSLSASLFTSVPLAQNSGVLPLSPGENPSLPIGGFAHSTPFSMSAMPTSAAPATIDDAVPALATLDSVPVLDAAAASDALNAPIVTDGDVNADALTSNDSDEQALPVVPSGRNHLTSTLSATLPLNAQETWTSDEESLLAPQPDAADLVFAPPPEVSPPLIEAPPMDPATKQSNKKKGRGSKLNLPAIKTPAEATDVVDQETIVGAAAPDTVLEPPPVPIPSLPFAETAEVAQTSSVAANDAAVGLVDAVTPAFNLVSLFEEDSIPAPEPVLSPPLPPLPPAPPTYTAPLSIDLSNIPPLPAIADFAAAAVQPASPLLPPQFVVEFDRADSSDIQQVARKEPAEELDPTVPLNVATGSDIENSRSLHQPAESIADFAPVAESSPSPSPSDQPVESAPSAPEITITPAITPVEQKPSVETAPKRALPQPAPFNREAVDTIFKHLTNEETGFITNSAFMFFIVREFSRFQKAPTPITLIGFELALRAPDGAMYPIHLAALRECGRRFFFVMRPLDWLAHYTNDEYALLLPHTNIREAILLVKDLYTVLNQGALLPGMEDAQVVMHCGIASIPEDCQHPGILIAAAYEAKNEAKRANLALQLFRDMPA